jgi:uncharacterized protein (DUF1330 family)
MAAYVIVQINVKDQQLFDAYRQRVPASIAKYGGEYLVRGGTLEVLEGDWAHPRCVVLKFPSYEKAKAWHASPEYAGPLAMRQAAADSNLIVVDGV